MSGVITVRDSKLTFDYDLHDSDLDILHHVTAHIHCEVATSSVSSIAARLSSGQPSLNVESQGLFPCTLSAATPSYLSGQSFGGIRQVIDFDTLAHAQTVAAALHAALPAAVYEQFPADLGLKIVKTMVDKRFFGIEALRDGSVSFFEEVFKSSPGSLIVLTSATLDRIDAAGVFHATVVPYKDIDGDSLLNRGDVAALGNDVWFPYITPDYTNWLVKVDEAGLITKAPAPRGTRLTSSATSLWYESKDAIGTIVGGSISPVSKEDDWQRIGCVDASGAAWLMPGDMYHVHPVVRLSADGTRTSFAIPQRAEDRALGSYGELSICTSGPGGTIWMPYLQANEVVRLDPDGKLTEYNVKGLRGRSIVEGPDGAMWFAYDGREVIDRITSTGELTSYDLPFDSFDDMELAADTRGWIWILSDHVIARFKPLQGTSP